MANPPFVRLSFFLLLATLVLFQARSTVGAKACFDVNGDQTNGLPCEPDSAEDGPCCALGDICLSNSLCMPGPDVTNNGNVNTYRSDCTDQSWTTDKCFSGCNNFTGNGLKNCGGNEYCCYDMNGCDCSATSLFTLDAYSFVTTLPLSTIAPTGTPASTSASATADSTQTTSQAPSSSAADESKPSNNEIRVGVGVGLGLGIPLLLLAGFMLFYIFRRRRSQPSPYASAPYANYQMNPAELHAPERVHELTGYDNYQPQEMEGMHGKPLRL